MTPYTFYVWGVLAVTLPSLWCALRVVPRGATADRVVKRCARLLLRACGCRLEVCGLRHLEDAVPAILVANHTSYLDAVVLLAALPIRYRFVVNHHAASWPFIGLAVRRSGHLIVDRASRAGRQACVRAMLQTVRDGLSLVVFPEGTIHPDGDDLLPFRPGAFQIAVRLGRPVVPVTLGGTRDVFRSIRRIRRGRLDVEIHPPITPADTGRREVARMRDDAARHSAERHGGARVMRSAWQPLTTSPCFTHWFRVCVARDYVLMRPMPGVRRPSADGEAPR